MWIVAYDIRDNRTRKAMARLLKGHGRRVNYSVYECGCTEAEVRKLLHRLQTMIDARTDSVLCYKQCKACYTKSQKWGKASPKTYLKGRLVL